MSIFKRINSFISEEPQNKDYTKKTLEELEYEWSPYKTTPHKFFLKWGGALYNALRNTVSTSLFDMANREGDEQEANIMQVKAVEEVFKIGLKRYGYNSIKALTGGTDLKNKALVQVKQMFGLKPSLRLDAKEEIIKDSICEFWDGFQREYFNAFHDKKGYVRLWDAKHVGKLFEYECFGATTWRGF